MTYSLFRGELTGYIKDQIIVYVGAGAKPGQSARGDCRECGWIGSTGTRGEAAADLIEHRKVCPGWKPHAQNAIDFEIGCMGQTADLTTADRVERT